MTVERGLRAMGGGFVLLSLALGHWVSPWFYLFTAFVGLNLLQSAFSNWCPAMAILRGLGLPESDGCCGGRSCCGEGDGQACCGGEEKPGEAGGCCGGHERGESH
jgi:hypothetical protein